MKVIDYQTQGLQYILAYHRQNKDVTSLIKAIGERFNSLQNAIIYLLTSYNINEARGIWLDFAGKEVGAYRDEVDFGNFFTVNRFHLNAPKMFYFLSSGYNPKSPLTLNDNEFLQKIFAYIGTNTSSGSMENLLYIVKTITRAEKVEIEKDDTAAIKLHIYGNNLTLTLNTINYIQQTLSNGIYLKEIKTNG